jgi:PleD family two-component response regulator
VIYSHDGLRDSLTQLAAPTLLYEELRRELSRATREGYPISLVRFVFASSNWLRENADGDPLWNFEDEVLRFAHVLTRLSRGEDVCARMGEVEFVCIIRGIDEATQCFISRILLAWLEENLLQVTRRPIDRARLEVSSLASEVGEGALDILARLDQVPTKQA